MKQGNSNFSNNNPKKATEKTKPIKKLPRRITESYLHNAGLFYLSRFSASRAHFKDVMMRKIQRSCAQHTDQDFLSCTKLLEGVIENFVRCGLLNDEIYAKATIDSLRKNGKSARMIQIALQKKGIDKALSLEQLHDYNTQYSQNEEQSEWNAALTFARKKKLGPYRGDKAVNIKKELAALARAGFGYEIAARVLNIQAED